MSQCECEDTEDSEEVDTEDESEDDGEEMLLSEREMKAIAGYVVKAMSAEMKQMKMMMRQKNSSEGLETLKDYTEAQNEFAEKMVGILEELNTRVKSVEAHIGTGHVPSESLRNAIGLKSNTLPNLTPQEQSAHDFWFSKQ